MPKNLFLKPAATFLISLILISLTFSLVRAQTTSIDLKIAELKGLATISADGKPALDVMAIIVNTQTSAAENCIVTLNVNAQMQATETFSKIENGAKYLFSKTLSGNLISGDNRIEVNVCSNLSGEKSPTNNIQKIIVKAQDNKNLTTGPDTDLNLINYRALFVRDASNTPKYWYRIEYNNLRANATTPFSIKQNFNGITDLSTSVPALPGKATAVTSAYFSQNPFQEGKNFLRITLDSNNEVPEKNEKNTSFFLVPLSDGNISNITKQSLDQKLLLQELLVTHQSETDQPRSPNGLILSIPMLNVGSDILSGQMKVALRLSNRNYEQTYTLNNWPKGTIQTLNFTNHFFKKTELAKSTFGLTITLDDKKLYSKNHKPACFY